ncbi:MAG: hypothetical protein LW720_19155 [Pirellula sp.]|nr:hypothetical protein [Pirellula sp.]
MSVPFVEWYASFGRTILRGLPLVINVKCRKREDSGDITNEIKGYAKPEAVTAQPQQANHTTPPWRRPS